jgi:transcriptional regulator with XRE-family HTH domain
MLSKIERGTLFPTLPTLLRIALVFGVGLEHFFIESKDRPTVAVIRKQDRLQLPDRPDETPPSYLFESLDFPLPIERWRHSSPNSRCNRNHQKRIGIVARS